MLNLLVAMTVSLATGCQSSVPMATYADAEGRDKRYAYRRGMMAGN